MPVILLTDPEQRAALAAARSLARAGHRVYTIGASRGLAGRSRSVSRHIPLRGSEATHSEALQQAVTAAVQELGVHVVIPVSDFASRSLLGQNTTIGASVAGPTPQAYERASDKARLLQLAQSIGLRVPSQITLLTPEQPLPDVAAIWRALVIKPARSEIEVNGRSAKVGVRYVDDPSNLAVAVASYPPQAFPLLLQERTIGDGVGVFLLRANGHTPLVFGHKRLHEKPPAGGVSTYREAVAVPHDLQQKCEQLLDALEYTGAAMLEFKRDAATGEYVLMEINARLWGSLQLAIDAGVDFPAALVAYTLQKPLPRATAPKLGVRSVWELGELDHALALARRSRTELHLPSDIPVGFVAAVRALCDRSLRDRPEVFRWSDPQPFLAEAMRWVRRK